MSALARIQGIRRRPAPGLGSLWDVFGAVGGGVAKGAVFVGTNVFKGVSFGAGTLYKLGDAVLTSKNPLIAKIVDLGGTAAVTGVVQNWMGTPSGQQAAVVYQQVATQIPQAAAAVAAATDPAQAAQMQALLAQLQTQKAQLEAQMAAQIEAHAASPATQGAVLAALPPPGGTPPWLWPVLGVGGGIAVLALVLSATRK